MIFVYICSFEFEKIIEDMYKILIVDFLYIFFMIKDDKKIYIMEEKFYVIL